MKNKKIFIYTSLIICYALTIIGGTYAYLQLTATKNNITAQVGCFEVNYQGEEIKHTNLSATTNYLEGARSNVTLSKDANCKIYNEAYIYIHVNNNITAPIETVQALKYKVVQGNNNISEGLITQKGDNLLATVPLTTTSTTYTIYIWVDASLSNKQYDEVDFTGYIFAESDQTSTVENNYTVTFNPNGGSVSPTTKSVSFRKPYGSLPTPTKSGYTFKGWNGKNLFNKDTIPYAVGKYIRGVDNVEISYGAYAIYKVQLKPNTTYTITNSGKSSAPGYAIYNSNDTYLSGENYNVRATVTFTTPATTAYIKLSVVIDNTGTDAYRYDKDYFQLEEDSTATDYEPYYITNSTLVGQNKNHTLYAIWE